MKTRISKENKARVEILLTVPGELLEDLKRIAQFNNYRLEDLVYSYIVDGVTSDPRVIKRMEFTDSAREASGGKTFHSKSAKEIINDLNIVY